MISLVLYFLAALGLSFVVGFSKLSLPVRVLLGGRTVLSFGAMSPPPAQEKARRPLIPVLGPWLVALLECPGCLGFWCGTGAWLARTPLALPVSGSLWGLGVLALATAATNLIGAKFIGMLE